MALLTAIKIISMISMFLLTIITGSIPLRLKTFKENQRLLSLTSAFSGGLFLSVGVIHLLPEASHKFEEYHQDQKRNQEEGTANSSASKESTENGNQENKSTEQKEEKKEGEEEKEEEHFPFSMLITVLSFCFVLMIEKVLGDNSQHHHHHHQNDNQEENPKEHQHNHNDQNLKHHQKQDNYQIKVEVQDRQQEFNSNQNSPIISMIRNSSNEVEKDYSNQDEINQFEIDNKSQLSSSQQQQQQSPNITMMGAIKMNNDTSSFTDRNKVDITTNFIVGGVEILLDQVNKKEQKLVKVEQIEKTNQKVVNLQDQNNNISQQEIEKEEEKPSQQKKSQIFRQISNILTSQEKETKFSLAPYIIQLAFGIHASLEGLAIGVQDEVGQCLTIALAVVAHKWAEGLVMGLAMKNANLTLKRATIMITIQGIMNPIGIGLGWALSETGSLISGILMSISAGTFLYIATNEVIVEEFNLQRYKKLKFMLLLVGVGFISSLWCVEQITGE